MLLSGKLNILSPCFYEGINGVLNPAKTFQLGFKIQKTAGKNRQFF